MAIGAAFKRHFTPRKILFYILFHGVHIFLFIVGW